MLIVDPEKAPRTFHDNYERFLKAELDNMMEFFFPVNSDLLVNIYHLLRDFNIFLS